MFLWLLLPQIKKKNKQKNVCVFDNQTNDDVDAEASDMELDDVVVIDGVAIVGITLQEWNDYKAYDSSDDSSWGNHQGSWYHMDC